MDNDFDDTMQWTAAAAERLRLAADSLSAAITAHAEALTSTASGAAMGNVIRASEVLLTEALAYADAQASYCGNAFPFGALHQFADSDDDRLGARDDADEQGKLSDGFSVLERWDYRLSDDGAVMEAGRRAYLRTWPEEDEAAAATDVTHLGRAVYQIAHADGWGALSDTRGLRLTGGAVLVVQHSDLLGPEPDDWPEDLFAVEGDLLYGQQEIVAER